MEPDKDKKPDAGSAGGSTDAAGSPPQQNAPADALEKTNDELGAEAQATGKPAADSKDTAPVKQPSAIKKFFRRFNVYLLLFVLVLVIAGIVIVVTYLNSKKTPTTPGVAIQQLSQDALNQLANSDATVGDTGQTLTVQGNAIFNGQVLVRSNLNVAGTIQLGGTFSVPDLVVSNTASLGTTQIDSLQVAKATKLQGDVTIQSNLNVAGSAAFSGPVAAGQVTVTRLILSGNAQLEVPNHVSFTGASPTRSSDGGVIGSGGTTSVSGSDVAGTVNINTGSGPTPGCFINLTFSKPFSTTPRIIVSPVGQAAGQTQFYVTKTTTGFSLCTANAAPANQTFSYDYFVTGT